MIRKIGNLLITPFKPIVVYVRDYGNRGKIMGLELIVACFISCAAAVTIDRVVIPKALSQYERAVDRKIDGQHVFVNLSKKTKA